MCRTGGRRPKVASPPRARRRPVEESYRTCRPPARRRSRSLGAANGPEGPARQSHPLPPRSRCCCSPADTQESAILEGSNCKTQARMNLIVPSGMWLRSSVAGRRAAVGVGALPLGGQEFPAVRARIQGQAQDAPGEVRGVTRLDVGGTIDVVRVRFPSPRAHDELADTGGGGVPEAVLRREPLVQMVVPVDDDLRAGILERLPQAPDPDARSSRPAGRE